MNNNERLDKYYKQIWRSRILEKQNTKDILNDLIKLNKEGKYKEAFVRYMYLHIKRLWINWQIRIWRLQSVKKWI